MALLDKLTVTPQVLRACVTQQLLDKLLPEEAEQTRLILDSLGSNKGDYTASWLQDTLLSEGYRVGNASLLRHARKVCCCYATKR
jgi:hypothetical protein